MNLSQKGFTLVELAIVMVIIGLLIGGILKGQAMVESARITSIITQMKSYEAATSTFEDRYGDLPGDLATARNKIPNCTATTNCLNGNGNRRIGNPSTNYSRENQMGVTSMPGVETTMYWKHLMLADLITGINPSAAPATPGWTITHPVSRGGSGGFAVMFVSETGTEAAQGHFLMLRASPTGSANVTTAGQGSLSVDWAYEIDRKIDDGIASKGIFRSDTAGSLCATSNTGVYRTPNSQRNCLSIYKLSL